MYTMYFSWWILLEELCDHLENVDAHTEWFRKTDAWAPLNKWEPSPFYGMDDRTRGPEMVQLHRWLHSFTVRPPCVRRRNQRPIRVQISDLYPPPLLRLCEDFVGRTLRPSWKDRSSYWTIQENRRTSTSKKWEPSPFYGIADRIRGWRHDSRSS